MDLNMRCGITCGIKRQHDVPGDFLYRDYGDFFEKKGIELVLISNFISNGARVFDDNGIEGLILSGGNSLGEEPARDDRERQLLSLALKRQIPLLGICRGMQFINRYFGGGMPQNIKDTVPGAIEHVRAVHPVRIIDGTFASLCGACAVKTNSFHNEGFKEDKMAGELELLAVAEDGVVEAFRHIKLPVIGVQWHPERQSPDQSINDAVVDLFKNYANSIADL